MRIGKSGRIGQAARKRSDTSSEGSNCRRYARSRERFSPPGVTWPFTQKHTVWRETPIPSATAFCCKRFRRRTSFSATFGLHA